MGAVSQGGRSGSLQTEPRNSRGTTRARQNLSNRQLAPINTTLKPASVTIRWNASMKWIRPSWSIRCRPSTSVKQNKLPIQEQQETNTSTAEWASIKVQYRCKLLILSGTWSIQARQECPRPGPKEKRRLVYPTGRRIQRSFSNRRDTIKKTSTKLDLQLLSIHTILMWALRRISQVLHTANQLHNSDARIHSVKVKYKEKSNGRRKWNRENTLIERKARKVWQSQNLSRKSSSSLYRSLLKDLKLISNNNSSIKNTFSNKSFRTVWRCKHQEELRYKTLTTTIR